MRVLDQTPCEGTGWRDDPTACGDPDHCSPKYPCECNPDMHDMHDCTEACHEWFSTEPEQEER